MATPRPSERTRKLAMLIFPGLQALDAVGPLEVFATANRLLARLRPERPAAYSLELRAGTAAPVRTSSGYDLCPRGSVRGARGPFDTLLVAGGEGARAARFDPVLTGFLRRQAPGARRVGAVCTGTFLLAEAGLLEGRRVTTHWYACDELAAAYPQLRIERDPIFVRDGSIYTSAGVTAGMDLALALVEEDLGKRIALHVARWLVLFLKRPGGQSQFSAPLAQQEAEREPVRELQTWIPEHLAKDLSVAALARRAAMSPRNFARVFTREVGRTPARVVEEARVEAARRMLEDTDAGVEGVAARCGFASAEVMRRVFLRVLRVAPSDYRRRFRGTRVA
jgi:transcriptional regulator GlxA family with amidase domain